MIASSTRHGSALSALLGRIDLRVALAAAAALAASVSVSQAQVELKTYMDDKGYLNVRALTCAQLANSLPRRTPTSSAPGTAAGGTVT